MMHEKMHASHVHRLFAANSSSRGSLSYQSAARALGHLCCESSQKLCPAGSLQCCSGRSHICHLCNKTWRVLASKLFENLESIFRSLAKKFHACAHLQILTLLPFSHPSQQAECIEACFFWPTSTSLTLCLVRAQGCLL